MIDAGQMLSSLFSTHPPLKDRIAELLKTLVRRAEAPGVLAEGWQMATVRPIKYVWIRRASWPVRKRWCRVRISGSIALPSNFAAAALRANRLGANILWTQEQFDARWFRACSFRPPQGVFTEVKE